MDIKKIILLFVSWRIILFAFLLIAIHYVPLQANFLGGSIGNYLFY